MKSSVFSPRFVYHRHRQINNAVNLKALTERKLFRPALGAGLTAFCGLILGLTPLGDAWVNSSYDYSFRFGARAVTNKVALIQMDNDAHDYFHQLREQPWDRMLHAQLLQRLATDGCSLVVFDSFFRTPRDPAKDQALADAMRRQHRVVLMAEQALLTHPDLAGARPTLPSEPFLSASGTNWGVAWLDPDLDSIVRRHWPFPAPGPYPSLSWTAARLAGAPLNENPQERWLRYYGRDGAWTHLSYRFALTQPTNFFRDQIVFIGTQPKTSVADGERDKFRTPYTRWTGETTGGVEIMVASFLNLMNGDWLRRPAWWIEVLVLAGAGILLGVLLSRTQPAAAAALALAVALLVALGAVSWSYFTNFWFPWLVIAGAQVPCALAWALLTQRIQVPATALERTGIPAPVQAAGPHAAPGPAQDVPDIPDYELLNPPFGQGAYGKVWLARNAIGQWQALKVVYLSNFSHNADPYEREFNGIRRYKPVSDKHPGLLRVDFVSKMKPAGYFYYVMELGDPLTPGWEQEPSTYKPRDLVNERRRSRGAEGARARVCADRTGAGRCA